ncbi:hypothetical protein ACIGXA_10390 [Streptomyces fildesensis]|uniref:Sigma-70 family RNA polymerase sigma factor n=1 Tax=Streptomyces fildesensis TaxID=375757 RepID=A0ABW8C3C4_9ACTN
MMLLAVSEPRISRQPDAALIHAVRKGQTSLFRQIYRRHYAAVYAYSLTCMPSPLDAFELSSYSFEQLLQKLLSGQVPGESRHGGCLRIQLLRAVRNSAVRRSQHDHARLSPHFRAWVDAGALWSMAEDGQLAVAYEMLTAADQCLVWHSLIENDDSQSISRIMGLSAGTIEDRGDAADRALRRARSDLYLTRLEREDCRTFMESLDGEVGEPLGRDSQVHLANCPACQAVYEDLRLLDTRLAGQLPSRLLGWWPAQEYLRMREAVSVPVTDPPFLNRALRNGQSSDPPGTHHSPHRRAHPLETQGIARLRAARPERVFALAVTAALLAAGILAFNHAQEPLRPPPPAPSSTAPRATNAPRPAPQHSTRARIAANAFDAQEGTEPVGSDRPDARRMGDSSVLRYEAVDFGDTGDRRLVARLAGPVGGGAWIDFQIDDNDYRAAAALARVFPALDGSLRDVSVSVLPVVGVHRVIITATCLTVDPCIALDRFGTALY